PSPSHSNCSRNSRDQDQAASDLTRRGGERCAIVVAILAGCDPTPSATLTRSSALVDVTLPAHADGAIRIRDARSNVELSATLIGARSHPAEQRGDLVIYREAFPGAELRHRLTEDGVEDFIAFARAPAAPSASYAIQLGAHARGLRLVENTLEVLDA